MCIREYNKPWRSMKKELQYKDILKLPSLSSLGKNEAQLRERLAYCKEKEIVLQIGNSFLQADVYMDILHIMEREEKQKKQKLKEARQKGIQKALQKRQEGKGNYGRPAIELPKDFAECIRECIQNHQPLETYRRKTKLKKSTFYKYVHIVKKEKKIL